MPEPAKQPTVKSGRFTLAMLRRGRLLIKKDNTGGQAKGSRSRWTSTDGRT